MNTTTRHMTLLGLATAAMAGLLWWSLRDVKFSELAQAFQNAHWGYLPAAFLMGMAVFPVKAVRWGLLIRSERKVHFRPLLSAIMIGFMVNCIFSRIGEVVRAAVLGAKKEARTSAALASIALERIFDMVTVVLFLIVALLWLHPDASTSGAKTVAALRTAGAVVAALFAGGVTFLALLRFRQKQTSAWVLACARWLPERMRGHVNHFLESFLTGLNALSGPRQVAAVFALSIVHWLFQVLYFYFVGLCFPDMGMTFAVALLVFATTAFGVAALPLPGYLGIFQGGVLAGGVILGALDGASARDAAWHYYAWVSWAANVPPIILIGFGFLWGEGLSVSRLRSEAPAKA